jgi:hypothetical protein
MHNYSLVLDRTIWSGLTFSQTELDCDLRAPDRTVWSFYWSLFQVQDQTIWSGFLKRFSKKPIVQIGPDHSQSNF